MARQVLPIVGAVVGGIIGGPMGAQAGFAIGSLIGNAVDPLEVQGNKIGDNPLQTASEGGARAIVFGKGCIRSTCILERGNRIVRKQRDQAGKGGGPVTINERVFWTFAIGLGEDLIGGAILRIWEGEKLVYDVTPTSTITDESAQFAEKFRFYDGSETQLPDPDLETIHGIGNAPYYRGTAYVVFPNFDLTDYRESIPVYRWEVAKNISASPSTVWFDTVRYDGDGSALAALDTLDLSAGGMVLVTRTDAAELPMIFYKVPDTDTVMEMHNYTDLAGGPPPDNPVVSTAVFDSSGASVPMNTSGAEYIAYVFRVKEGAFNIVPYSGNGLSSQQVAHGLGVPPAMHFVRQLDDPTYTIGWMHLQPFAGNGFLVFSGANDYSGADTSVWGGVAPDSDDVTVGYHAQVNSSGRGYVLFAFGGSDTYSGTHMTGSEMNIGFEPDLFIVKRRKAEPLLNFGAYPADPESGYEGTDIVTVINGAGGAETADDRIEKVSDGVYLISNLGTDWGAITVDVFAIRGGGYTPGEPVALGDVVSAIHDRCGHTSEDYDASALSNIIQGVIFEQSVTGAEAINSLIGSYVTDPSEYDGKINYVRRGASVERTLIYDDLVDEPDTTQRQNPIEYPRKLHYFFQSSITAYAATKATSSRSSPDLNAVKGEVSVASPITYDDADEPAKIAAMLHKINWTDAEGEIVWEITDEHLDLVPTDCVGLSLRGRVTRARITNIEDSPGIRKLTMRVDRQSAYTSDVTGIPLPTPTPPQSSILSPTVNAYMDIPALLDSHDIASPVYYDGMSGQTDVWPGAVLQRSLDGGSSWTNVTATTINAIMGVLQNTVSDASQFYTDTTNQVVVRLYMDDEIESITNTAFKSEGGAFVLSWETSEGRQWEVMQYRDAQQDSNGDWVLTTLHRGRLDSETAEHPPGSTFVLLDTAIRMVTAQTAWIDTDLTHRAITNGMTPESAAVQTELYTARSQTEWPVAHLFLEQDSAGDTTATVVPRHRFGTSLNPIASNNWRGYRWTVTDGSNTITREGTSEVEVFDTSSWGAVTVTVSQLNRLTGAGPSVSETIP